MLQFRAETGFLFSRMSKLQSYPAVLRSIDVRGLSFWTGSAGIGSLLLAGGCLSSNIGSDETTQIVLSSSTGEPGETGSSGGSGIMTTTVDPNRTTGDSANSESASGTDTGSGETSGTTTGISVMCGDGVVQPDEECDAGDANADDGACTTHCKNAACGDGLLHAGVEVCDDGVNDGSYDGCMPGCTALAGYCGDGMVQGPENCDDSKATGGCLQETCTLAKSCKELKDAYMGSAVDGLYTIAPLGAKVQVVCDMDADGGGYTMLKIAQAAPVSAKAADLECAKYGMRLMVPRSKAHLASVVQVAQSDVLGPIGLGNAPKSSLDYLTIFGIYPKVAYQGCAGKPFNNVECTTWTAFGDVFWVTGQGFPNEPYKSEPATKSCTECSLRYYWANGVLTGYESIIGNNGEGAQSDLFLCEVPDMLPLK